MGASREESFFKKSIFRQAPIALGKAWRWRNQKWRRVKPLEEIQRVKVPSGQS